ncbi:MAG: 1-propanol dehydrogenase PduQ [Enterococcus avium]
MKKWSMKPEIYSGFASLERLQQFEKENLCFVCDPYLAESDSLKRILGYVKRTNTVEIYSDIIPDPPIETVVDGIEKMTKHKPTVVIAVGGGSAIDTAKAMLFFYKRTTGNKVKRFVAIPTTSGTGSEVTSASVITDTQNKIKYPIFHEAIIPHEAILDASLVMSSPPSVTAFSGLDVLTHALESLASVNRTNYTNALAEKATELVFQFLPTCVNQGMELDARIQMHEASTLAGLAFDAAGLGVCHAIAHQVGANFKVPHGLANSMLLPYVIQANSKDKETRKNYARISRKLGICPPSLPDHLAVSNLAQAVQQLANECKAPIKLNSFGIQEEAALSAEDVIANNALNDTTFKTNPIQFSAEEIKEIYRNIIK